MALCGLLEAQTRRKAQWGRGLEDVMNEKTVRDWAFPAFFAGMAWLGLFYGVENFGVQMWVSVVVLVAILLTAVTVAHYAEYARAQRENSLAARQILLLETPDSRLMNEARQLAVSSPDLAAEMAKRIGRPDLILFPSRQGRRPQIKIAGSDVTLQFALNALDRSDETHFVAQRAYSEGTYLFDPNRELEDRKQWMQFNWLLAREGMCQRYVPNQAVKESPMWLPPWGPQKVLDLWLLTDDLVTTLKPFVEEREAA
jgi:hypothetical protein